MSKGLSFASLLAMWIAALRAPAALGVKVTVKVVLVLSSSAQVMALMVKSLLLGPSLVTLRLSSGMVPVQRSVKVIALLAPVARLPKSMLALPSMRFVLAGCSMAISGVSG